MSYYDRFSGKSRFVQDGSYKKKVRDQNKIDWRNKKGFQRDQAKANGCWCKMGRYLKDVDHRSRRAFERDCIANERWDDLTSEHKDQFTSSWDAC